VKKQRSIPCMEGDAEGLTPYAEEIIGDHQCGFQHNRLTTDHISSICQILEKK